MKKIFTVLSAVLISVSLWAQAPQSFSYQAVVRGTDNALVSNKKVGMKISLLQGSETGTAVYVETHTPISNTNGLVSIAIGGGTVVSGTFASIDWSKGPYFVKTETDPAGGTSYSLTTISQLLSVPYALHAKTAESIVGGSVLPSGGTNGQIITNCDGIPTWTTGGICPGKIASLNCAGVSVNGSLNNGELASNVSFGITYTGGNGGSYSSQSISSTSVIGLTATLQAGTFEIGNGSLTFTVSGTPSSVGNALFSFTIAGQVCSISMAVVKAEDTDFQFTATFNGSTYSFKDKTFNEQGLMDNLNFGALCKTFQDTTAMLLCGVNAAKDDTLTIYFMDKSGASKSSFAIGNTTFPLVDPQAGEPSKYVLLMTSKNSDELFTCLQSGDNCTLTVTKSDDYSATSAIKGTFAGKVSSLEGNKQYTLSGSFRARKVKD